MNRYDRIMQAIGLGLSDERIAARHKTDSATIHVYRLVHDGALPKYTEDTAGGQHWYLRRDYETIADRLTRTIKGWHA